MASLFELFVSITGDNSSLKKSIQESGDALGNFGKLTEAIGEQVAEVATKMFAAFTVAEFVKGLSEAAEAVEKANIQIQRSTGESGAVLDSLKGSFDEAYGRVSQSASQVSGALSTLYQRTRLTGEALTELTVSSAEFAKVAGVDLASSVSQNEKLFAQWGVSAGDQSGKLDELLVASQKTGVSTQELSQGMLSAGAALREYGVSFDQALALVASFAKAGLDVSDVVAGLKRAFTEWAKASKDPQKELANLIDQMRSASTKADAVKIAVRDGFSPRSIADFVDAVRRGVFDVDSMANALKNASGEAHKLAQETATLSDNWAEFTHRVGSGVAPLWEGLKETLSYDLSLLNRFIDGLAKTLEYNDRLVASAARGLALTTGSINTNPGNRGIPGLPANYGQLSNQGGHYQGGGGAGLTDKQIGSDFSALGVKDLTEELAKATAAYNELRTAGKLTGGELASAAAKVYELQVKLYDSTHTVSMAEIQAQQEMAAHLKPNAQEVAALLTKIRSEKVAYVEASNDQIAVDAKWGMEAVANLQRIHDGIVAVNPEWDKQRQGILRTDDIMQQFGLTSTRALRQTYENLLALARELQVLVSQGKATGGDLERAMEAVGRAHKALTNQVETGSHQQSQYIQQVSNTVAHTLGTALDGLITHTRKVSDAFKQLGRSIISTMLQPAEAAFARLLTSWITHLVAGKAAQSTADSAHVTGEAGKTGAAAFASVMAALPFPANVAAAPLVAETQMAEVLANYLPLAAFRMGGNVPYDMPAFLHANEMVLPADIAGPLRANLSGAGGGTHFHFEGASFGQSSMQQVIRQLRLAGARI